MRRVVGTDVLLENTAKSLNLQNELLMSQKFHDTIIDSEWLKYRSFSPGKWAVDYGFLYTLYRVLDNVRPHNIIEFGLGQSSRMIHQYSSKCNAKAITIEHDPKWVEFFSREVADKYRVNVKMAELQEVEYKNEKTLSYKNIPEIVGNEKFDLVVVDGPFGTEHFSRSQVIEIAKNNLQDEFCIIIDDYERPGEQETGQEIMKIMTKNGIAFSQNVYSAEKQHLIICSSNLGFLTTL